MRDETVERKLTFVKLNPPQKQGVEQIEGALLIIAGAGSGKTGVITSRIANMLKSGIPQNRILALTFTNKAASEMEERVRSLTHTKLSNLTVSTFHAFGLSLLKEFRSALPYRENFTIYDSADQLSCLKKSAQELKLGYERAELLELLALFSKIKTRRIKWTSSINQHKPLFDEYQEHLVLYNAVDFDDLIVVSTVLLEENPEILRQVQDQYRYIMVDEFQDTSLLQYHFIHLIAQKYRNICCVGDDDQSIYSWRGANYQNITNFEKDFPERIEIKLEQNYRSTGGILKAANAIISNNTNRKEKELWTSLESENISIRLQVDEDNFSEAQRISETIFRLRRDEGIPYSEFGILTRTNTLSAPLEEALLKNDIPYTVTGGQSFFQRQEIKDITAYLRVIVNPDDDMSLRRIINTPRRGIGKRGLELISQYAEAEKCSLFSTMASVVFSTDLIPKLSKPARDGIDELYQVISTFQSKFQEKKVNIGAEISSLVDEVDYFGYLILEHSESDKVAKWKYENLKFFSEMCNRWQNNPDTIEPTLSLWLNRITLITRDDRDSEDNSEKVNLMTIHASKGLEFRIVFLAGVEDGIIPHARAIEEGGDDSLQEERRLFYVAVTRAKEQLYLSCCRFRKIRDDMKEPKPSPFLEEIPLELIHQVDEGEEEARQEESLKNALENLPWK